MVKKEIIFVGGIHGVGKGRFCEEMSEFLSFEHLSASEILKWSEISKPTNKKVESIRDTQERLIDGITKLPSISIPYVIDGHFTLFNRKGKVSLVPKDVFVKMGPKSLIVLTYSPEVICERLRLRDGENYSLKLLSEMQEVEVNYAREISEELKIPLLEMDSQNILIHKKSIIQLCEF